MNTNRRSQPLYRDESDKMLGGVCSGLGRYFDIDTMLVRVAFVVVALLGGGGVLAYLLLWVILDPAPPVALDQPSPPPPLEDQLDVPQSLDDPVEQPLDVSQTEEPRTDES